MNQIAKLAADMAAPKLAELGLELWDAEFKKEGADYYLRLYINRPDGTVGIEDCEAVDAYMSPLLDEADPIEQSYYFEVSSAGLVRTLSQDWHYDRYLGREVSVGMFKPAEGLGKKFTGILKGYDGSSVTFTVNGVDHAVPKENLSKITIDLI